MRSDNEQQDLQGLQFQEETELKEPFAKDVSVDRFFADASRTQRLGLMLHLAPFGGVLLFTGDEGVGKSALLKQFVSRLGDNYRPLVLTAKVDLTASDLFTAIKNTWLQRYRHEELVPMKVVRQQLAKLRQHGETPIIIIDDAHQLLDEVLLLLAKLISPADEGQKLITVVLAGQPELRQRLLLPEHHQLQAHMAHSFDLMPLQAQDSARYIKHQLSSAGVEPGRLFSPTIIKFIHLASGGVPKRINDFARVIWRNSSDSFRRLSNIVAHKRSRAGLRLIVPVVVLVTTVIIFLPQIKQQWPLIEINTTLLPKQMDEQLVTITVAEDKASIPVPPKTKAQRSAPVNSAAMAEQQLEAKTQSLLLAAATGVVAERLVSVELNGPLEQGTEDRLLVDKAQIIAQTSQPNVVDDDSTDTLLVQQEPSVVATGVKVQQQAQQTIVPASAPTPQAVLTEAGKDEEKSESVEQRLAVVKPDAGKVAVAMNQAAEEIVTQGKSKAKPSSLAVELDEAWLLSRGADHYTVQLTAMETHTVEHFISQNALHGQARVFRVKNHQDDAVLAVVVGDYRDRLAAKEAAQSYQRRVAGVKPWVRSLASVQKSVTDFQSRLAKEQHNTLIQQHEQQLLDKVPQRYTLQLMAMDDEVTMGYVKKYDLQDKIFYFRPRSGQQGLLAAVTGEFASKDEAEKTARELMRQLPGIKPWARSVASVQQAIRQR